MRRVRTYFMLIFNSNRQHFARVHWVSNLFFYLSIFFLRWRENKMKRECFYVSWFIKKKFQIKLKEWMKDTKHFGSFHIDASHLFVYSKSKAFHLLLLWKYLKGNVYRANVEIKFILWVVCEEWSTNSTMPEFLKTHHEEDFLELT